MRIVQINRPDGPGPSPNGAALGSVPSKAARLAAVHALALSIAEAVARLADDLEIAIEVYDERTGGFDE